MDYLNSLEKDNFDINEDNKELICYKINYFQKINDIKYLDYESLPLLVERIVPEKKLEKIKKLVFAEKYQKEFEELIEKYCLAGQYYFYFGNVKKLDLYDRNHYLCNAIIVLMNILHPEENVIEIDEDEVIEIF